MSAAEARGPVSRDPLVVNTQDGTCWMRRAVTREGRGLYAVADAPACCPEFVMATLAELAEHGLASMVDALPMPVGSGRQVPELERLRVEVAALREERHSTNEALSDAAERMRADRDRIAELETRVSAEENIRPHRQAIANSNLHYIGKLELRIRRTRFLHVNHPDPERCEHDGMAWPCPTVAALEAAVGEAVHPCGCPKRFGRHADGCPTEVERAAEASSGNTLPAWLYQRFMPEGEGWEYLDSGQREYWEHQAHAVRRAVERGGFKSPSPQVVEDVTPQVAKLRDLLAGQRAAVEDPHDGPLAHRYLVPRDLPPLDGAQ
jgi:hypothetical protein